MMFSTVLYVFITEMIASVRVPLPQETETFLQDYQDIDEESEALPEALNIPGETVSSESLVSNLSVEVNTEEEEFQAWWLGQKQLKKNVREVCDRYGQSLKKRVPLKEFMFDAGSRLLFCRNAKVKYIQHENYLKY